MSPLHPLGKNLGRHCCLSSSFASTVFISWALEVLPVPFQLEGAWEGSAKTLRGYPPWRDSCGKTKQRNWQRKIVSSIFQLLRIAKHKFRSLKEKGKQSVLFKHWLRQCDLGGTKASVTNARDVSCAWACTTSFENWLPPPLFVCVREDAKHVTRVTCSSWCYAALAELNPNPLHFTLKNTNMSTPTTSIDHPKPEHTGTVRCISILQ